MSQLLAERLRESAEFSVKKIIVGFIASVSKMTVCLLMMRGTQTPISCFFGIIRLSPGSVQDMNHM